MNILAIGGGELKAKETLPLDAFIVEQTFKKSARALFIPTASGDSPGYCQTFDDIYGTLLGCQTEHLLLSQCKDRKRIEKQIRGADLIYVGGGNTLRMMKLWRALGVDGYLKRAGLQGTLLAGLSAGAICWHQWGHSDSEAFSGNSTWAYIRVKGLGFRPHVFCPHLNAEKRHEPFSNMLSRWGGVGVACDNNAAVWYDGDNAPKVMCSTDDSSVWLYRTEKGRISCQKFYHGDLLDV